MIGLNPLESGGKSAIKTSKAATVVEHPAASKQIRIQRKDMRHAL